MDKQEKAQDNNMLMDALKRHIEKNDEKTKLYQQIIVSGETPKIESGVSRLFLQHGKTGDEVKKIPTGIGTLDKQLRGGLPCGESYVLLTSNTGTGKTLFSIQCARAAIESGHRVFVQSDEDGVERWKTKLLRMFIGPRYLDRSEANRSEPRIYKDAGTYCSAYYSDYVFFCDPVEAGLNEWAQFEDKIVKYSKYCDLFIIDNLLSLVAILTRDKNSKDFLGLETFRLQSYICDRLRYLVKTLGICVLLIAHKKKGQAGVASEDASDTSGSQNVGDYSALNLSWVAYRNPKEIAKKNDEIAYEISQRYKVSKDKFQDVTPENENSIEGQAHLAYERERIKNSTDRRIVCDKNRVYGDLFRVTIRFDRETLRFFDGITSPKVADSWEVAYQTKEIPRLHKLRYGRKKVRLENGEIAEVDDETYIPPVFIYDKEVYETIKRWSDEEQKKQKIRSKTYSDTEAFDGFIKTHISQ